MKGNECLSLLLLIFMLSCDKKDSKRISLPIEYHQGYGPFIPGWSILSGERKGDPEQNEWLHIKLPIKNIPKGWSHVKREQVWLDHRQLVYQNYKQGKLSKEFYEGLLKSWNWLPDEKNLSASPIKCFVYVIWGVDENGNWTAMIDTNNNLDFGDEKPFVPEVIEKGVRSFKKYSEPLIVNFEKIRNGKVVSSQVPMLIKQLGSNFVYNFPRFASSKLNVNGKEVEILISSSSFTNPCFESTAIVVAPVRIEEVNLDNSDLIDVNQVINLGSLIGGEKYKNLGVDRYSEVLMLEGFDPGATQTEHIIQSGYVLKPFEAKEFSSGVDIASNSLKGKYVLIDFWGTWCQGCVVALPKLNKIYNQIDKTQVEFIGIAKDEPVRLKKGIIKYQIKWPQILSDSANKLIEKYKITGFPTSILLDREGKILDMNLSPEELEERLNKLLVQQAH